MVWYGVWVNLIEITTKAKVIFLPPYSPDLMHLEEVFIEVKSVMKANDDVSSMYSTKDSASNDIQHGDNRKLF